MRAERLFAAVDIGTVKVCALAAEMTEKGPRVLASAIVPSRGIKKGAVVSRDEAAASVQSAVRELQNASGRKIPKMHITAIQSQAIVKTMMGEIIYLEFPSQGTSLQRFFRQMSFINKTS